MPRKTKVVVRNPVSESERMKCCMLGMWGGPHHRLIAKLLYGNRDPNYSPSSSEISRVGSILRQAKISTRDWRNGETEQAKKFFSQLGRLSMDRIESSARSNRLPFRFVA